MLPGSLTGLIGVVTLAAFLALGGTGAPQSTSEMLDIRAHTQTLRLYGSRAGAPMILTLCGQACGALLLIKI
jgi:hypothetical protein